MFSSPQRRYGDIKTFTIYIDSFSDSVISGEFFNPFKMGVESFNGLTALVLRIDECLNTDNVPQHFSNVRTFYPSASVQEEGALPIRFGSGKIATFSVNILYRQNASWQGTITWLEEKVTQHFRSVLELIYLVDNALDESKAVKTKWSQDEVKSKATATR